MSALKLIVVEYVKILFIIFYYLPKRLLNTGEKRVCLWGDPVISLVYINKALNNSGIKSFSIVKNVYSITSDFDYINPSYRKMFSLFSSSRYFVGFFNSPEVFFGRSSKFFFAYVTKLTGGKFIFMPYGADAFEYSKISDLTLRHMLNINYSKHGREEKKIEKRLREIYKYSDCIVACPIHINNLSSWDILPVHYYPIDSENIPRKVFNSSEKFIISHSPNHRGAKGTEFIIQAVSELKKEGVDLELDLLEKLPNKEVLVRLSKSDLLIEQVVGGCYAMSGMEGMAVGIPVISYMSESSTEVFRMYSYLNECPVVNSGRDIKTLKEAIKYSIHNRKEIGEKGLEFVKKYHSLESNALMWNRIFDYVDGKKERPINYFHPLIGDFYKESFSN